MTQIKCAVMVLVFAIATAGVSTAQPILLEVLARHGVEVPGKSVEAAFDAGAKPTVPLQPGSLSTPLAMLTAATGADRVAAAYAFGILAGRSAKTAPPQELAAAGQVLLLMVASDDRRARIAGARVAGRVFASPFDPRAARPQVQAGLADGLFVLLNRTGETEQLAAMDALGLMRETQAVAALTERYRFYREAGQRALAGGALEALARIGDASSIELVKQLLGDKFAEGNDPTMLVVWFARERLLNDGSISVIREAALGKRLAVQARGYLEELGAPTP